MGCARRFLICLAFLLFAGVSLALAQAPEVTPNLNLRSDLSSTSAQLSPAHIVSLSILATVGLAVMWGVFWLAVARAKESARDVLLSAGFFRTVSVMGVIAATAVLSLAGRLDGNVTGAILSGIVGYVLGQLSGRVQPGRVERD